MQVLFNGHQDVLDVPLNHVTCSMSVFFKGRVIRFDGLTVQRFGDG
jgi:hypothetical protein